MAANMFGYRMQYSQASVLTSGQAPSISQMIRHEPALPPAWPRKHYCFPSMGNFIM
jgi:hypothetical protein